MSSPLFALQWLYRNCAKTCDVCDLDCPANTNCVELQGGGGACSPDLVRASDAQRQIVPVIGSGWRPKRLHLQRGL